MENVFFVFKISLIAAIASICFWVYSFLCWHAFLRIFKFIDDTLQNRHWDKFYSEKGFTKVFSEDGKPYYIGYDD